MEKLMKKILIIADVKGWIFERHALEIKKRLTEYEIDVAYLDENRQELARRSRNYDLIYTMDPMPVQFDKNKTISGLRCEFLYKNHPDGASGFYNSVRDKFSVLHVLTYSPC